MKAQYFSFDVVIALALFIITLMFIISYWYNIHAVMETQYSLSQDVAQRIGNSLMTPGIPETWHQDGDCDSNEEVGLAIGYNNTVISPQKWGTLSLLADTGDIGDTLHSAGWNVCLNLTYFGETSATSESINCGSIPDNAYKTVYRRICSADFTSTGKGILPSVLEIVVWRDYDSVLR